MSLVGTVNAVINRCAALVASATASDTTTSSGGYDAIESRGRRRPPRSRHDSSERILNEAQRTLLTGTSQDLHRNFAIARWAVNKHLDFVTSFRFQANTGIEDFDDQLERFIEIKSRKENFDCAKRHPLRRYVRLMESQRVVLGDHGTLQRKEGRVQAIESDRVRNPITGVPANVDLSKYVHGVRLTEAGEATSYIITNRGKWGGYEFAAVVPAHQFYLHAWYDRFDQVRGVTPLAPAIALLQDLHEAKEYALGKMKIEQLFGVKFKLAEGDDAAPKEASENEEGEPSAPYKIDFGRGLWSVTLDPGDDAEILQGASPSSQFQEFWKTLIHVALKCLDIPFSFFDESFTNFFGSRGSLMQYLKSVRDKREDIAEFLHWWTEWQITLGVLDGELKVPDGVELAPGKAWQWIPAGVPWWDPAKEVRGDAMAIAAGLDNYEDVVMRSGESSVYRNIDINARVQKYAREKNVTLVLPGASGFNPEPVVQGESDRGNAPRNTKGDRDAD